LCIPDDFRPFRTVAYKEAMTHPQFEKCRVKIDDEYGYQIDIYTDAEPTDADRQFVEDAIREKLEREAKP
jgi:hypothetical protein